MLFKYPTLQLDQEKINFFPSSVWLGAPVCVPFPNLINYLVFCSDAFLLLVSFLFSIVYM